jgi:O-antigen/teichoic acid export membrane protein
VFRFDLKEFNLHGLLMSVESPQKRSAGKSMLNSMLWLLSGNFFAPILALMLTPALSRLYEPRDFGILAILFSFVGVYASIATWRFDMAIVLPEEKGEAERLTGLSFGMVFAMSILAFVAVGVFGLLKIPLKTMSLYDWIWVLPFTVFLRGMIGTLSYWATRHLQYKSLAAARASESGATLLFQLAFGCLGTLGVLGLVSGRLLGILLAFIVLAAHKPIRRLLRFTVAELKPVAAKHYEMPRYALQTNLVNALSAAFLPILMAFFFGQFYAGLVFMVERLVRQPLSLIVNAIWQVTHSDLPRMDHADRLLRIVQTHRVVVFLFSFPTAILLFFAHWLGPLLGARWFELQYIAPWLAGSCYLNMISNSTSYFIVFGKNRVQQRFDLSLLACRLLALIIGARYLSAVQTVALYSVATSVVYITINIFWGIQLKVLKDFIANLVHYAGTALALVGLTAWLTQSLDVVWQISAVLLSGLLYGGLVWPLLQDIRTFVRPRNEEN